MSVLVADMSAWHHSGHPAVIGQWRAYLAADRIAATPPMRLEVLYSAQSAEDYAASAEELDALQQVACGAHAFDRAMAVQRALGSPRAAASEVIAEHWLAGRRRVAV
ncbi:MAG TPA: hypothetical protein VG452_09000 [Egibacteraceae bacterium]|nr:hypothetical protein [Egibacteraceae bacterium]